MLPLPAAYSDSPAFPLLYVFLNTASLAPKRRLLEDIFGLPLVEREPRAPHEKHGVVKYDAGGVLLALNIAAPRDRSHRHIGLRIAVSASDPEAIRDAAQRDGYVVERGQPPRLRVRDQDSQVYEVIRSEPHERPRGAALHSVTLLVKDLASSIDFYSSKLGLPTLEVRQDAARIACGEVTLSLQLVSPSDAYRCDRRSYLLVFYTPNAYGAASTLSGRGVRFRSRVSDNDIGCTARLVDPDGHPLCIYTPSSDVLSWGSGPTVHRIVGSWRG
jgi:catechol 2,3-dioxygenase-like lactoylglutathione lyase family enzyme